jgi:hypothetical protein
MTNGREEGLNMRIVVFAAVFAAVGCIAGSPAKAQNLQTALPEVGAETGNWGLTPFTAIPTFALRADDRAAIRALEDQHIKERRAFEDNYETELRRLIRKQAEEREALRNRLAAPH